MGGQQRPAPVTASRASRRPGQDNDHDNDNVPGGAQMCGQEQGPQTFSASIGGSMFHNPTVTGSDCHLTQADRTAPCWRCAPRGGKCGHGLAQRSSARTS